MERREFLAAIPGLTVAPLLLRDERYSLTAPQPDTSKPGSYSGALDRVMMRCERVFGSKPCKVWMNAKDFLAMEAEGLAILVQGDRVLARLDHLWGLESRPLIIRAIKSMPRNEVWIQMEPRPDDMLVPFCTTNLCGAEYERLMDPSLPNTWKQRGGSRP